MHHPTSLIYSTTLPPSVVMRPALPVLLVFR
jgi:hypothetical protein